MLNLATLLETSARAVPERTAVVLGVQRLTYAELDAAACRVAGLLHSRGVGPGDKVALSCPNLPWFPIIYYGILKAGAVAVPLNVLLKGREIAYHLADSEAKAYSASRAARSFRWARRAGPDSVGLPAARTSS
ncbi:AMP-binding protein [Streptomyces sp. RKAG290]|uniref:AMP-binding protein n=1 Tax=Streptomyces sp. RKAG290 TaxID=2888348 RepID=UPI0027E2E46A|nr:AMP-binding protein [Streptomyces sp. RKAG290]